MIHRALLGSIERFFGILVEHYGGAFPLWLSPVQAVIIPVNNTVEDYTIKVLNKFKNAGIRIKLDNSSSRMNAKIREYQAKKIPYMFIIGEREAIEEKISIRTRTNEQINEIELDEALKLILLKVRDKEI